MEKFKQLKKWQKIAVVFLVLYVIGIFLPKDGFEDGKEATKQAAVTTTTQSKTSDDIILESTSVFKDAEPKFNPIRGLITFTLSSNLTTSSAANSYYIDILEYCKLIHDIDLQELEQIHFYGKAMLTDKYENRSLSIVMKGILKVDDIKKINYANADFETIKNLMEMTYIHPDLNK